MENKVLVDLYVPVLEKHYEIFLPANRTINEIIHLLGQGLIELSGGYYEFRETEKLYDRLTGKEYPIDNLLKDTNIRNNSQLVLF